MGNASGKNENRDPINEPATSTNRPATANDSTNWTRQWPVLVLAILAVTAIGLIAAFGTGQAEDSEIANAIRSMPVRAEKMEWVTSINQVRKYTGDIRARQESELGFEFSGRIAEILVDEGDSVKAGQTLAVLDIRTLEARRDAMNASLNQAKARMTELEAGPRQQTIAASQASVREAKSALQLAELNFERRRKLRESKAISTEEFQRARFDLLSARAVVDSAQKRLDELEAGTRNEQITAQQAAVAQLQASSKEVLVQIEKSSIIAPFAGRIVQRSADPGGMGLPSQSILKLVETDHLEAVVGLPADVAESLQPDDSIFVNVGEKEYTGKVIAKIQQIEMATRTQKIVILLDSSATENVLPGQLCQIEVSSLLEVTGYWVPATALTNGIRGLWSLMLVDEDSRASRRDVEVIYTDGDRVLVRGTISGDALVITQGTHRLVDGQSVEVLKDLATTGAAESP